MYNKMHTKQTLSGKKKNPPTNKQAKPKCKKAKNDTTTKMKIIMYSYGEISRIHF